MHSQNITICMHIFLQIFFFQKKLYIYVVMLWSQKNQELSWTVYLLVRV